MSKDQKLTDDKIVEIVDNFFKEIDDLKIKINKLDDFLNKNSKSISDYYYVVLYTQYNMMQSYRGILNIIIMDLQNERSKNR